MYPGIIINYTVDLDITGFLDAIQGNVKSSCTEFSF
jgi:hypothetical protein